MTVKQFLNFVRDKALNLERVTVVAVTYDAVKQGGFQNVNEKNTLYMNELNDFIDSCGHLDVQQIEFTGQFYDSEHALAEKTYFFIINPCRIYYLLEPVNI